MIENSLKRLFYKEQGPDPEPLKPKRNASFDSERRGSRMSELSGLPGSEGYGACPDEVKLIRAQGECLGIRSRRRS